MKLNITRPYLLLLLLLPLLGELIGCADTRTFTTGARKGETVALAIGRQQYLQRQNLTVTITDAAHASTVYLPNDPRVRGIVNLYPDPASRAAVGQQTGQDLGYNAVSVAAFLDIPASDSDWYQTTLFLDLPTVIATGPATISFSESTGITLNTAAVEVLSGTASSDTFDVYNPGAPGYPFNVVANVPSAIRAMERADNYTIEFPGDWGAIVPHAIQLEFTHTFGIGKPWVVNPRGDLKHTIWSDDGTNLRVMITPANGNTLDYNPKNKFYIAGGIAGLVLKPNGLKAYDINGSPITGVTATVTAQ